MQLDVGNEPTLLVLQVPQLLEVHMAFNPHLDTNMAKSAICVKDYRDRFDYESKLREIGMIGYPPYRCRRP